MGVPLLVAVLVFFAFLLLGFGVYLYVSSVRRRRHILSRIRDNDRLSTPAEQADKGSAFRRGVVKIADYLGQLTRPKTENELTQIQRMFAMAGLRRKNILMLFFAAKIVLASALSGLFLLLQLIITSGRLTFTHLLFVSVLLAVAGFYLPTLWLKIKVAKRKEDITRNFPEALDLLVVSTEAGMGLDAAINRVGEEMKLSSKALSEEFRLLNLELRAGKSRRDAMKSLAQRTDIEDVSNLVTLLIQTDRFGTSIAQALRVHSDSMRTRRTMKVEELAAKLPVKLLFPCILFIFPALFVVIMGPALIQVYNMWLK